METKTIQQRLFVLPTTAISDAIGGHTNLKGSIKPLSDYYKIAGRALTVQLPDGENKAVLEAISKAQKGDILVIDAKGNTNRAVAGDFVISLARGLGVQGLVVDGVIRDIAAVQKLNFPIFSLGTTIAAGFKHGGGAVGVPIAIGGVPVHPGDYVVGDIDGVVIIPSRDVEQITVAAEEKVRQDELREAEVLSGGEASIRAYLDKVLKK